MRRRAFLRRATASGLLGTTALHPVAAAADRDRFGGWTGKTFGATGFFRLERDADRHWLVTPDGSAYLIFAMDHVGLERISRDYNREHWYAELGLSLAAGHESKQRAFYRKKLAEDREYLGFNCLYSHQAPAGLEIFPYIPRTRTVAIEYWRTRLASFREDNFLDVFSTDFVSSCSGAARAMARAGRANDPWVVAHALTDCPVLVPEEARARGPGFYHKPLPGTTTWPVRLRNLPAEAPGKGAYVNLMHERYGADIARFNAAYNTAFGSWDALSRTADWRPRPDPSGNANEERDSLAFLLRILDKAWGTQVRAIRTQDPNHLVFGDTLNLNSPLPDEVVRLYTKHFPVIVYQYYGATWEDHRRVLDRLRLVGRGMPVFSADSCWSVPDPPRMPDTLGPQCANYAVAARRMEEVFRSAFARSDFLGWGWCGWMDQWVSVEPYMQHAGLQDPYGNWHQPLADTYAAFGGELYEVSTKRHVSE